ncbi:hypothetical protein BDR03DRAFT_967412 [Suillus americanus]|nr:hypothetical protein BDR03DRAFT_967412 [Suillus americanus]
MGEVFLVALALPCLYAFVTYETMNYASSVVTSAFAASSCMLDIERKDHCVAFGTRQKTFGKKIRQTNAKLLGYCKHSCTTKYFDKHCLDGAYIKKLSGTTCLA